MASYYAAGLTNDHNSACKKHDPTPLFPIFCAFPHTHNENSVAFPMTVHFAVFISTEIHHPPPRPSPCQLTPRRHDRPEPSNQQANHRLSSHCGVVYEFLQIFSPGHRLIRSSHKPTMTSLTRILFVRHQNCTQGLSMKGLSRYVGVSRILQSSFMHQKYPSKTGSMHHHDFDQAECRTLISD